MYNKHKMKKGKLDEIAKESEKRFGKALTGAEDKLKKKKKRY